jgi:hypothetical protein
VIAPALATTLPDTTRLGTRLGDLFARFKPFEHAKIVAGVALALPILWYFWTYVGGHSDFTLDNLLQHPDCAVCSGNRPEYLVTASLVGENRGTWQRQLGSPDLIREAVPRELDLPWGGIVWGYHRAFGDVAAAFEDGRCVLVVIDFSEGSAPRSAGVALRAVGLPFSQHPDRVADGNNYEWNYLQGYPVRMRVHGPIPNVFQAEAPEFCVERLELRRPG